MELFKASGRGEGGFWDVCYGQTYHSRNSCVAMLAVERYEGLKIIIKCPPVSASSNTPSFTIAQVSILWHTVDVDSSY